MECDSLDFRPVGVPTVRTDALPTVRHRDLFSSFLALPPCSSWSRLVDRHRAKVSRVRLDEYETIYRRQARTTAFVGARLRCRRRLLVMQPDDLHRLVQDAFNAGDVDGLG